MCPPVSGPPSPCGSNIRVRPANPCTAPALRVSCSRLNLFPSHLNLFSPCHHLPFHSEASCNFYGPKCLRQPHPGKDCPNERVCLKPKHIPEYHMGNHHSGFQEQGLRRQLSLEASEGPHQSQAHEMNLSSQPHQLIHCPRTQEGARVL